MKAKRKRPIFRDKKCVVCGATFTPRTGSQKTCRMLCSRLNKSENGRCYRENHPEIKGKRARRYREKHPLRDKTCVVCGVIFAPRAGNQKACNTSCSRLKIRENVRRFREKHPEEIHQRDRRYREKHPEQIRRSARRFREKHPEELRESNRRYRKKYPEKQRRRAAIQSRQRKFRRPCKSWQGIQQAIERGKEILTNREPQGDSHAD